MRSRPSPLVNMSAITSPEARWSCWMPPAIARTSARRRRSSQRFRPLSEAPQENFEDLFDSAPCGYLSLFADGRIARANRRIAQWLGYAPSDLIGRRLQNVLSVPGRIFYETNISPLLHMQGFVDEVAMDFLTAARVKVPCLVNAAERRDADGDLLFTRLTVFQAAERRR